MKVCIIGIARSGTTAIYSLLQEILLNNVDEIDFIYEPFLWDPMQFNDIYDNVRDKFQYTASLSSEGIYNHQILPMLINDPEQYRENSFLNNLLKTNNTNANLLIKSIRANGRVSLINAICPECKIIFFIRNPIDSVYSVMNRFSYFGGEFHKDDYPRFQTEVRKKFKVSINHSERIHKELDYWFYMNKYALESFEVSSSIPLILCHEEYVNQREESVKKICTFLGLPYKHEYLKKAIQVKENTTSHIISSSELDVLASFWEEYVNLLKTNKIVLNLSKDYILSKYTVVKDSVFYDNSYYGISPYILKQNLIKAKDIDKGRKLELFQKKKEINELSGKHEALKKALETLENRIQKLVEKNNDNEHETDIEAGNNQNQIAQLKNLHDLLSTKNDLIAEMTETILRRDNKIREKNEQIQRHMKKEQDAAKKIKSLVLDLEKIRQSNKNYIRLVEKRDNTISEKNQHISELESLSEQRQHLVQDLQSKLSDKKQQVERLNILSIEKTDLLHKRDQKIREKNQQIENQQNQIDRKSIEINKLTTESKEQKSIINTQQQTNQSLRHELNTVLSELEVVTKNLANTQNAYEKKANELTRIYNSKSWKIGHFITSLAYKLFSWTPFIKKTS